MPPNTYVVLDIPAPIDQRVLRIRERQRDPFRHSLPAETTVSGSSGTGPIAANEDLDRVRAVLDRIAAETAPIPASFGPVRRFPDSDVFYLSFADEGPLRSLHGRVASSGLRFQSSPFPFGPHCTVRSRAPISGAEAAELLTVRVDGDFVLDTLSLYDLPAEDEHHLPPGHAGFATLLCLLHRVRLTGRR